ncbi:MAG: beta strand repeat-containing protein, partial [Roseimicrobium sp.]
RTVAYGNFVQVNGGDIYRFIASAAVSETFNINAENYSNTARWAKVGGQAGSTYVYVGTTTLSNYDLSRVDYSDTSKWKKIGGTAGAIYQYIGAAGSRDLRRENYADTSLWTLVQAGGITLTSTEKATIDAKSVAASFGLAAGALAGVAISGAGADAKNIILTKTSAHIDDSTVLSAANLTLTATDETTITAKIQSIAAALGVGVAGVGVAVGSSTATNYIGHLANGTEQPATVTASIIGSQVTARGSISLTAAEDAEITAEVESTAVALAGGASGNAAAGAGVGVYNKVAATVKAFIQQSRGTGITTSAGGVTLTATDTSTITATGGAAAVSAAVGANANAISIGVAIGTSTIKNVVEAYVLNSTVTTTTGGLTITATETATVVTTSQAAAVAATYSISGLTLAGGGAEANSYITTTTRAYVDNSTLILDGDLNISATNTSSAKAEVRATSVAVGAIAIAVSGSVATAIVQPRVEAYATTNSTAPGINAKAIVITAQATPKAEAIAASLTVSTGLAVGVSKAIATVAPQAGTNVPTVAAYIGGAITANSLTVLALQTLPASGDSAYSTATGSTGGLLVGIDATVTSSTSTSVVRSYVMDDSTLTIRDGTLISASSNTKQRALSSSVAVGGLVAVGITKSTATSTSTTNSYFGNRVKLIGSTLSINASGIDNNYAETTAGAGGVVGAAAAEPTTNNTSTTAAGIGEGSSTRNIDLTTRGTGLFTLVATHQAIFNTRVKTDAYGFLSGSGADADNDVNSSVDAYMRTGANLKARSIDISATNRIDKPSLGVDNIYGTTGGLASAAGATSDTHVTLSTEVAIAASARLEVVGIISNERIFKLRALNIINAVDTIAFLTAGALSGAGADATFVTDLMEAILRIGPGAVLLSPGALDLSARGQADVKVTVSADTFGAATVALGETRVYINPKNSIIIESGTTAVPTHLRAYGNLNISAGRGSEPDLVISADSYKLESRWDGFAGSVIPISSIDASAFLFAQNQITIGVNSLLQTARQANLFAGKDAIATMVGKAKTVSWVSSVADALGGTSAEAYAGHILAEAQGFVEMNGKVETGITRDQSLVLNTWSTNSGGSPSITGYTASPGITFTTGIRQLESNEVQQLREARIILTQFGAKNATLKAFYEAEINRLQNELTANGQRTLVRDPVTGQMVEFFATREVMVVVVDPIWAQGGRIDVDADQIYGTGEFIAASDVTVEITNNTPFFIELKGITVPSVVGGLFYNGKLMTSQADVNAVNIIQAGIDNSLNYDGVDLNEVARTAGFVVPPPATGSNTPQISVRNTLNVNTANPAPPGGGTYPWPGITVLGPDAGGTGLYNDLGNVLLETHTSGTASINILGAVRAKNLTVIAGGDVYVSGLTTYAIGGEPASLLGPATSGTYNAGTATAPGVVPATEGSTQWNLAFASTIGLLFNITDIKNFDYVLNRLTAGADLISYLVWSKIDSTTKQLLLNTSASDFQRQSALVDALNDIALGGALYHTSSFGFQMPGSWWFTFLTPPGWWFTGQNLSQATINYAVANTSGVNLIKANHML